jgi:hypothetical protein
VNLRVLEASPELVVQMYQT